MIEIGEELNYYVQNLAAVNTQAALPTGASYSGLTNITIW